MTLTNEDVQEILALLDDLEGTELHLRTRHFHLSLRRDLPGGQWVAASAVTSRPQLVTSPGEAAEPAAPAAEPAPAEAAGAGREQLVAVRTPLMGTFYRAPKPGAPPFVELGDAVDQDTVIGIVETMKLMNSVYAGVRGTVAEICLGNAEPAAQGAVLMRVAPEDPAQ